MNKLLSVMTLGNLWKLFPISLIEHQKCWREWYEAELISLHTYLPMVKIERISHIGSKYRSGYNLGEVNYRYSRKNCDMKNIRHIDATASLLSSALRNDKIGIAVQLNINQSAH